MNAYHFFRDTVAWQPLLGEQEYPGVENLGPDQTIPARIFAATRDVAGDQVSTETIWTFPEHAPGIGDRLNGGRVLEVDAARAPSGAVVHWITRVTR